MNHFHAGQLLNLEQVAEFIGQPLNSVRRWVHSPPDGFPQIVWLGKKITIRFSELEAWAMGSRSAKPTQGASESLSVDAMATQVRIRLPKRPVVKPRKSENVHSAFAKDLRAAAGG
jgi:hypothetical protein